MNLVGTFTSLLGLLLSVALCVCLVADDLSSSPGRLKHSSVDFSWQVFGDGGAGADSTGTSRSGACVSNGPVGEREENSGEDNLRSICIEERDDSFACGMLPVPALFS